MKLTARQSERRLTEQTRYGENSRAIARAILVDGKRPSEVNARHMGLRQAAHRAASQVSRACLDAVDCPEGWRVLAFLLQEELARQIKKLAHEPLVLLQRKASGG